VNAAWQKLRALNNVAEMTLMAHFADAENPDGSATLLSARSFCHAAFTCSGRKPSRFIPLLTLR
jgi:alanine racemase